MSKLNSFNLDNKEIEILIVEDEIILAMAMQLSLEEMGFYVSAIKSDANSAIKHVQNNKPDLVIMDINLDNSSGLDAANNIWKNHKIPIIFLTSYTNDRTINKAMECEPYGYLIKPCKDKELKATITMALHKHKYFFSNKDKLNTKIQKTIIIDENLTYDKSNNELFKNGEKIKLTKNEKKLLQIMSEKLNETISFEQISSYIWREELYEKGKLRTLIYRLKKKLEADIFENYYEHGYKLKVKKIA